jgi:hypothetical protein
MLLEVKSINHSIIRLVKSTNLSLSGHVEQMHGTRTAHEFCRVRVEDNNKMDIREVASSAGMHCTELANLEQF